MFCEGYGTSSMNGPECWDTNFMNFWLRGLDTSFMRKVSESFDTCTFYGWFLKSEIQLLLMVFEGWDTIIIQCEEKIENGLFFAWICCQMETWEPCEKGIHYKVAPPGAWMLYIIRLFIFSTEKHM